MNKQGIGLVETMMAMGVLSLVVMTLFASFAQTSKIRTLENISMYGGFLSREVARVMSDGPTCNHNLVGKRLTPSRPLSLSQIETLTGVPVVSTSPSEVYYNGIKIPEINLISKKQYSPTESRVVLELTMDFRGQTRKTLIEGFVTMSGNTISDCRLMGAKEETIEEMCNAIKGAQFEPSTGECQVRPAGTFEQLPRVGSTGDLWSFERAHVTACPEGTAAVGLSINGDSYHVLATRLICKNVGTGGAPEGPQFRASAQAGKNRHDSLGWSDSSICPANRWMVGYTLKAHKRTVTYGSRRTGDVYGFKHVSAVCADRDHKNQTSNSFTTSPIPNYNLTSQILGNRVIVNLAQKCSKGTVIKEIRAGNHVGTGTPGQDYLSVVQTYCN